MNLINIENVSKSYGSQKVLSEINVNLHKGQCVAIIGPNGSGKTTLIKAILRLIFPDTGGIHVKGRNIKDGCSYREHIGYMPQISRFPENMKVSELFKMVKSMRSNSPDSYDMELYEEFGIEKFANKKLSVLSGGMKQKVSATLAFLFKPEILILDEPTAALDPISNEVLKNKIRKSRNEEKLILISSHILSDLDTITSHVLYLYEGKQQIFKSIEQLKTETSEDKLNEVIVELLKTRKIHA